MLGGLTPAVPRAKVETSPRHRNPHAFMVRPNRRTAALTNNRDSAWLPFRILPTKLKGGRGASYFWPVARECLTLSAG